jgi:hypothetical protein
MAPSKTPTSLPTVSLDLAVNSVLGFDGTISLMASERSLQRKHAVPTAAPRRLLAAHVQRHELEKGEKTLKASESEQELEAKERQELQHNLKVANARAAHEKQERNTAREAERGALEAGKRAQALTFKGKKAAFQAIMASKPVQIQAKRAVQAKVTAVEANAVQKAIAKIFRKKRAEPEPGPVFTADNYRMRLTGKRVQQKLQQLKQARKKIVTPKNLKLSAAERAEDWDS